MQCSLMVQSSYTPHTLKEMLGWIEVHLCIDISDDTFPTSTLASQTTSTVEVHVHIGGSLFYPGGKRSRVESVYGKIL